MIAASEPQEFVPSGRQQIGRHPGQLTPSPANVHVAPEAFLLHRLQKVTISENEDVEQWTVREAPITTEEYSLLNNKYFYDQLENQKVFTNNEYNLGRQSGEYNDEFWGCKSNESSFRSNRLSDIPTGKVPMQIKSRFASDSELHRSELKPSFSLKNECRIPAQRNEWDRPAFTHFIEEELYIKGNVAIWSKGLLSAPASDFASSEKRVTICTYTMETPIKHGVWCTFYSNRPKLDLSELNIRQNIVPQPENIGKSFRCLCLMDSLTLRVFSETGEDFLTNLQTPISNIYATQFGILLEKDQNSIDDSTKFGKSVSRLLDETPTIFSLSHPLDEVAPILIRNSGAHLQILADITQKVVFTNENPSLCMIFDRKTGLHSIYTLRRVRPSEYQEFIANSMSTVNASNQSTANVSKQKANSSLLWSLGGLGPPLASASPYYSRAASVLSAASPQQSRCQSPLAPLSRGQSPISPLLNTTAWLNRSARLQMTSNSTEFSMDNSARYDSTSCAPKRYTPELCLDHVWTENQKVSKDWLCTKGAASKVFLSKDFVGQMHFCYLVPVRGQIFIARMEIMNNMQLIIGVVKSFRAKDAISVPHLNLMAVLEPDGQVILRSGLTVVGKLHVCGVSLGLSSSPHFISNAAVNHLSSPFPRRSSLLPHCKTPLLPEAKFNESNILSPIPPGPTPLNDKTSSTYYSVIDEETYLISLRDSVFDRVTLQYSDNLYYRIRLPPVVEGSLIKTCLSALRQALQRDLAMMLISRWYATRNAPGSSDISMEKEWDMFTSLLLSMLGYDIDSLSWGKPQNRSTSPTAKRKKVSDQGDNADWLEIVNSETNVNYSSGLNNLLFMDGESVDKPKKQISTGGRINTNSSLFVQFPLIFYTLHLVYEELKLNMLQCNQLPMIGALLHLLAKDLRLKEYVVHYWLDFPEICPLDIGNDEQSQINDIDLSKMSQISFLDSQPANIKNHLYKMMQGKDSNPYPFINKVNPRSKNIIRLCSMILAHRKGLSIEPQIDSLVRLVVPPGSRYHKKVALKDTSSMSLQCNLVQNAVVFMAECGFTRNEIENLPPSINLLLHEALWQCRENPPASWPASVYQLLERMDLATQNNLSENKRTKVVANDEKLQMYSEPGQEDLRCPYFFANNTKNDVEDGMENMNLDILKLRFPNDHRVTEIRRLLQSTIPVPIKVIQRPEVTDHDYIEEQEKHLYAVCTRTMALPVGRGMFTLRTHSPVITETLPIPKLCLSGKAPPRGTAVELSHIDTPPNMNMWPLFHNGVAAGLRISPNASNIDSTWIVFNKPKSSQETSAEHAGFLMALGLNGHLRNLAILYTYEYLIKINELTSIGLLLGLAATKRGTMHTATTKMLSIHIEALLPPTSMELDVPQNIQIAALLGIGLVYEGSSHRHITEVLLAEIGRPPGPEMENSIDRESYSLAAGLALGLVTLCQGGKPSGLADLAISDTLHYYMAGGNKRPLTGSQKDKYKVPSFQIREGSCVNLDVTAPGATLALGLMYLGSGSKAIADWMRPPDTQYLLDFVRPDLLLLRIIARALILWEDIVPSIEWVENQVPVAIRPYCLVKPEPDMDRNIDFEAMNQAYCNIIAGACFALGLRFAGSANENAFQVLHHYCRMFVSLTAKSIAELAGKPTIESCLNLILLSLAMVMAGTGDLSVMRFVRHLRRRVYPANSATVTYGSHLSMHMALGLLFLGGGRLTLSSSPSAVAAMLCAFFPKFPTHSNDNRYHLQAFRHLYVLAVEPRLLIPRDIIQETPCYTNLTLCMLDGITKYVKAPCILPELRSLNKIIVNDERYWPIVFERNRNWEHLLKILNESGYLDVKQRAGCLSYIQDPTGTKSLIARAITQSNVTPWRIDFSDITSFSSDSIVQYCINQYLSPTTTNQIQNDKIENVTELKLKLTLSMLIYECVTKDKIAILPTIVNAVKAIENLKYFSNTSNIWELKLICAQVLLEPTGKSLISHEFALTISQQINNIMDSWQNELQTSLKKYIRGEQFVNDRNMENKLSKYVTYFDIPYNLQCESKSYNLIELLFKLNKYNLPNHSANKILDIINS